MYRLLLLGFLLFSGLILGQNPNLPAVYLKLDDAISLGLKQNKKILAKKVDKEISKSKQELLFNEQLPEVEGHYAYNRLSRLRQYQNGGFAGGPTKYFLKRSQYELDGTAVMPLYKGGKIHREKKIARVETEISEIAIEKSEKDVKMDLVSGFLDVYNLLEHLKVIEDHIKEDNVLVNHIKNLEKNGLVTYNEILRAELQLKQDSLEFIAINNDVIIANERIKYYLSAPEDYNIVVDTTGLTTGIDETLNMHEIIKKAHHENQTLKIGEKEIDVKKLEVSAQKADYLPHINLVAHYKLSYPNFMFFPPENYAYTFGFYGLDVKWNLSNLYTNREKVKVNKLKLENQHLEHEELEEKVNFEVKRAYTKYIEAQEKIKVYNKAVVQAEENFRIVKSKYLNQLCLITELIDADNTLLETQSKLISSKIEKQLKYYQLQYIIGTL
jgi:outer membrane protein